MAKKRAVASKSDRTEKRVWIYHANAVNVDVEDETMHLNERVCRAVIRSLHNDYSYFGTVRQKDRCSCCPCLACLLVCLLCLLGGIGSLDLDSCCRPSLLLLSKWSTSSFHILLLGLYCHTQCISNSSNNKNNPMHTPN
jgi:hypothetical protein